MTGQSAETSMTGQCAETSMIGQSAEISVIGQSVETSVVGQSVMPFVRHYVFLFTYEMRSVISSGFVSTLH